MLIEPSLLLLLLLVTKSGYWKPVTFASNGEEEENKSARSESSVSCMDGWMDVSDESVFRYTESLSQPPGALLNLEHHSSADKLYCTEWDPSRAGRRKRTLLSMDGATQRSGIRNE